MAGCEGIHNIHDNIIVHGRSIEKLNARLHKTLEHLRQEGLTLNKDKCVLRMSELTFMGYLLSSKGIGPSESRVQGSDECERAAECRRGQKLLRTSEL